MDYEKYLDNAKNDRMSAAVTETAALLLKKPVAEIKMTEIAENCGIGVASLYRYFGTKTNIVIQAAEVLWQQLKTLFDGVFECGYYSDKNGAQQLRELFKVSLVLYSSHKDFIKFLADFDNFVLQEKVPKDELSSYDNSIMDFLTLYNSAVDKGISDGSLKQGIDYATLYRTVSHSLILMSEKFTKGEILGSDTPDCTGELQMMIDMTMNYVSTVR